MSSRRSRRTRLAALLAVTAVAVAAGPADAQQPDRQATVEAGAAPFTWAGEPQSGAHGGTAMTPYPGDYGACALPHARCDRTLLRVDGAPESLQISLEIDGSGVPPIHGDDIDLYVYASDASATLGRRVGQSENGGSDPEFVALRQPRGWYLVHAVWAFAFESGFQASARAVAAPLAPPSLPPVPQLTAPSLELPASSPAVLAARGLPAHVTCPTACSMTVTLTADRATARRLRLRRPRIASATARLAATGVAKLALRPRPAVRERLRGARRFSGTVTAVVRDAAGGRQTVTGAVALRR